MTSRGNFYTVRQVREALSARQADMNPDGSFILKGEPPIAFLGIMADDNEMIVTEACFYVQGGEEHRLIDAMPGDPGNRMICIY